MDKEKFIQLLNENKIKNSHFMNKNIGIIIILLVVVFSTSACSCIGVPIIRGLFNKEASKQNKNLAQYAPHNITEIQIGRAHV